MKFRYKYFFVWIALCFCLLSCGDEGIEVTLRDLGAAAPALSDVGTVPEDIKEIIWGKDVHTLMTELEDALKEDRDIWASSLMHQICYRHARDAYYTKYINAGGIAIMGHRIIDDRFFYAARDIIFGMTQKRPELRELLTPSRENRPNATAIDGMHDVTKQTTPSRKFFMVLVHESMSPTSIPEQQFGIGAVRYTAYMRAGGAAGSNFAWAYIDSFGGENIDIYHIFAHECAHAIHYAIRLIDPTFDDRLKAAYAAAKENGSRFSSNLYYGWVEYWAFSVTYWFHEMASSEVKHNQFRETDPLMYALLSEWFNPINLRVVESRVYE